MSRAEDKGKGKGMTRVSRGQNQTNATAATDVKSLSHGTNANPSRGATIRQTLQRSVSVSAASETEVFAAVEVDADVAVFSCVASSYCCCRCPQHDRGYKIL